MVLENKLGIKNSNELAKNEELISKKKAVLLFENLNFSNFEIGKLKSLAKIHEFLFDDIYDFAGKFLFEE